MTIRRFLWPKSLAGKAGIVAIFFGVTLVIAYLAACKYTSERLAEAWKLSDEFGLPNDFKALLGEPVPPERNMAMPLDQASTIAQQFQTNLRMSWKDVDDKIYTEDPKYIAAFEKLLADPAYENAIIEADRRTEYYSPVVVVPSLFNIVLTYLQTRRELVRSEQSISRLLVSKGKRDEAAKRLVRMLRLMRRWEDKEPFLIGALLNIAVRTVVLGELNRVLREGGPLPAALHDEIEREAAETEKILRAQRRIGQTEKIAGMGSYDDYSPLSRSPILRPLADNDRAYMLRYYHRWMKLAEAPHSAAMMEMNAMDAEFKKSMDDPMGRVMYLGARMMLPAVGMARNAFDRLIAYSRCLRIVNAMARRGDFKADPATLGLPAECLIDPMDDKPMRIKQTGDGPIVYSVGPDQKDDGGNLDQTAGKGLDFGLGPTPKAAKK